MVNSNDDTPLLIPSIASSVFKEAAIDKAEMEQINKDLHEQTEKMRAIAEERGIIQRYEGDLIDLSVRAVDGSVCSGTAGEFDFSLSMAINVKLNGEPSYEGPFLRKVICPASESFGSITAPYQASAEMQALSITPNDVRYTFYDGSLQGLNYGISQLSNLYRDFWDDKHGSAPSDVEAFVRDDIKALFEEFFNPNSSPRRCAPTIYASVFNADRRDIIASSKRNTSIYFFKRLQEMWESGHEIASQIPDHFFRVQKSDRLLLQQVLEPREYIRVKFEGVETKSDIQKLWGLTNIAQDEKYGRGINKTASDSFINRLYFLYFRPYGWSRVFRLEFIADDDAIALEEKTQEILGLMMHYCSNPRVMEPYPLWLADKLAKQIQPFYNVYKMMNVYDAPLLATPNRTEEI